MVKKHGTKRYNKVLAKIGRLKEHLRRVARRCEINIQKDDDTGICGKKKMDLIAPVGKQHPLAVVFILRKLPCRNKSVRLFPGAHTVVEGSALDASARTKGFKGIIGNVLLFPMQDVPVLLLSCNRYTKG
ncbi:MAG: hypothetical protein QM278_04970 [Pseudomonadota bacterium]|nr:hypothetical protein [Pseudomonadota bacterium]